MNIDTLNKMALAAKHSPLDLFEIMYFNNPVGLVNALRIHGLTSMVNPDPDELQKVLNRLILRRDFKEIASIISQVQYDSNSRYGFTNAPELWNNLGVSPGNFIGVFNQMI